MTIEIETEKQMKMEIEIEMEVAIEMGMEMDLGMRDGDRDIRSWESQLGGDFWNFEGQLGDHICFQEIPRLRAKELEGAKSKLRERKTAARSD